MAATTRGIRCWHPGAIPLHDLARRRRWQTDTALIIAHAAMRLARRVAAGGSSYRRVIDRAVTNRTALACCNVPDHRATGSVLRKSRPRVPTLHGYRKYVTEILRRPHRIRISIPWKNRARWPARRPIYHLIFKFRAFAPYIAALLKNLSCVRDDGQAPSASAVPASCWPS